MKQKNSFLTGSALKKKEAHKSHKKLWISLSILVVILFIPILVAGWFGFVPGLSSVIGSNKPRDLGVRYSQADVANYKKKSTIHLKDYAYAPPDPKNPAQKSVLAYPKNVRNMQLTQQEITAAVNSTGLDWLPIRNVQVRLTDGVVEISGSIIVDKLDDFQSHISGNHNPDIDNAITWAQRLGGNPPFYAKAHASIKNNVLSFKLDKAEIGRLNIPLGESGQNITRTTLTNINSDEFVAKSATLTPGALTFSGTYPTSIYLER